MSRGARGRLSHSLTFTPSQPLVPGAYKVLISEVVSALGPDGSAMQAPYTFSFTVQ